MTGDLFAAVVGIIGEAIGETGRGEMASVIETTCVLNVRMRQQRVAY